MNENHIQDLRTPETISVIMDIFWDGTNAIIDIKCLQDGEMYRTKCADIEHIDSMVDAICKSYKVDIVLVDIAGFGLAVYERICNLQTNIVPLKCRMLRVYNSPTIITKP